MRRRLDRRFNKPHYLFWPQQILSRVRYERRSWDASRTTVMTLPWGSPLECWPADMIGSSIGRTGLYDLLVTEALFRLAGAGELTIDAGANVGYATNVLACAVGPCGQVICVEPQPLVFAVLERNVERWSNRDDMASVRAHRAGLSASAGAGVVVTQQDFTANRGTSVVSRGATTDDTSDRIALIALDGLALGPVGVLKLDVEGHELAVLQGGRSLLAGRGIRDIVFEENERYPTPVTRYLEHFGYEVFGLRQGLAGPLLVAPGGTAGPIWDPPILLATADAPRMRRLFRSRGWRAL